jgi:hypothetical protein
VVKERDDHVDLEPDKISRQRGQPIGSAPCVPALKDHVLARDPAEIPQRRAERGCRDVFARWGGLDTENPDPIYLPRLLRLGGDRRREQNEDQEDLADHRAPSSARPRVGASGGGGTPRRPVGRDSSLPVGAGRRPVGRDAAPWGEHFSGRVQEGASCTAPRGFLLGGLVLLALVRRSDLLLRVPPDVGYVACLRRGVDLGPLPWLARGPLRSPRLHPGLEG